MATRARTKHETPPVEGDDSGNGDDNGGDNGGDNGDNGDSDEAEAPAALYDGGPIPRV